MALNLVMTSALQCLPYQVRQTYRVNQCDLIVPQTRTT